jgi:glycosyltransferase involved in cell wall biosynthesis
VRHSIISWDCCYRNFFHTAFSLSDQEFDFDNFEVIYVEQRTKAASDRFNRQVGLSSLGDVVRTLEDRMNIRVLYLGDGPDTPLHWGRAVNLGIQASRGEIISVMDGDLLVDRDLLSRLDREYLKSSNVIVNLHRRMVRRAFGAPRDRWTEQRVTFDACLDACPDRDQPLPDHVQNYGPMISARREHWDSIGGYDEHRIWSTGLSRIGEDVTRRLEIQLDARSHLLPDTVCVHPWHPVGFRRDTFAARRMLSLQGDLIEWARSNKVSDWKDRGATTEALYGRNRRFIERVLKSDVAEPSVTPTRLKRMRAWLSGIAARLLNREFRQLRGELASAVRNMLSGNR